MKVVLHSSKKKNAVVDDDEMRNEIFRFQVEKQFFNPRFVV